YRASLRNHDSLFTAIAGNMKTRISGNSSMRLRYRLLQVSLLATGFFTIGAQAQEAVKDGLWSDSSTWSGGDVPQAGDIVTIGAGLDVVLDVSPPDLNGVEVEGKLSFSNDS